MQHPTTQSLRLEREKLAFEREKWAAEIRLREREAGRDRWANPLVVAIFAATLAATGNAIVAYVNGTEQRAAEQIKADQGLILEAIKANAPDKAATNLRFLTETGLISNQKRRSEIITFINRRQRGEGPVLPSKDDLTCPANPDVIRQFLLQNDKGLSEDGGLYVDPTNPKPPGSGGNYGR